MNERNCAIKMLSKALLILALVPATALLVPVAPTHTSVQADYESNIMNTYGRYPLTVSHGKGCKIYDIEGKEYLDFAAGIATW